MQEVLHGGVSFLRFLPFAQVLAPERVSPIWWCCWGGWGHQTTTCTYLLYEQKPRYDIGSNPMPLLVLTSPGKVSEISLLHLRLEVWLAPKNHQCYSQHDQSCFCSDTINDFSFIRCQWAQERPGTGHSCVMYQSCFSLWFILRPEQLFTVLWLHFSCVKWQGPYLPTRWWYCRN